MTTEILPLHPLTFVVEADGVLVGRTGSDTYAVLPADGAALLHRLEAGDPLSVAAGWYEQHYGEPIDLPDFVATLEDLGFVATPTDDPSAPRTGASTPRQRWLGSLAFGPVTALLGGALLVGWLLTMAADPALLPHPRQLFFLDSIVAAQLFMIIGQLPLLCAHESAHVLAGWRAGLPSRLGISTRLFFVVFETHLNGLLGLPRRRRYLPFLAGMLFDLTVIMSCGVLAGLTSDAAGRPSLAGRIALALAFPVVMRLLWQGLLFLRTDLYYLIATALGCHDLDGAARARGANLWRRLRGRATEPETAWGRRDRSVARWYAPAAAVGVTVLCVQTAWVLVQLVAEAVRIGAAGLAAGSRDPHFWDIACALALCAVQVAVFVLIKVRERRTAAAGTAVSTTPTDPERNHG